MTVEALAAVIGAVFIPTLGALIKMYSDIQMLKSKADAEQTVHQDLKNISDRLIRVEVLLDRRLPKE